MKKEVFFNFRKINFSRIFAVKNKKSVFRFSFILLLILGFFIGNFFIVKSYENKYASAQSGVSPDAIAIRVIPNPDSYSALRWYKEQKFSGSPQSILVDGYEAVRDGRTVYINAANIDLTENKLYTNIYLISHNQEAEDATVDIFGRILKDWKFNTNLPQPGTGICSIAKSFDSDCAGTVGCWHFNGDLKDSSGNNNNGTGYGEVNFINDGAGRVSAKFDGENDYISVDNSDFKTPSYTVSAWINHDTTTGDADYILSNLTYGADRWLSGFSLRFGKLLSDSEEEKSTLHFISANNHNYGWGSKVVPLYKWTHIVMSFDSSTCYLKKYINGNPMKELQYCDWPYIPSRADNLMIGKNYSGGGGEDYFHGLIDELKIYDRALSWNEIIDQCAIDSDCGGQGFCDSLKARITRDVLRLSHLADMKTSIADYAAAHNNKYPVLAAGTYIANHTISSWPSWSDTFAKELGVSLPKDPINKLGSCPGYNSDTCWDEQNKKFADPSPDENFNLPDNSYGYVYETSAIGDTYKLCANMETGSSFESIAAGNCLGNTIESSEPAITRVNLPNGTVGAVYKGYAEAIDADGDLLTWTRTCNGNWTGWNPSCPQILPAQVANQKMIYADKAGAIGDYSFTLKVDDKRGGVFSKDYVVHITSAASACFDNDTDGYDGCNPDVSDDDGLPADCDDNNGNINPGRNEICNDNIDNDCDNGLRLIDCADPDCSSNVACGPVCGDGDCDVVKGECSSCADDCSAAQCCGNGKIESSFGEECDDGNPSNADECNACEKTYCGDNITQNNPYNSNFIVEQCDDGNTNENDNCNKNCQTDTPNLNCNDGECNGFCPPGCTIADDPDCGCSPNNGCCGRMCAAELGDNDCLPGCEDDNCDLTKEDCATCSLDCDICGIHCKDGVCDDWTGENDPTNPNWCEDDCGCKFPIVFPCVLL